MDAKCFSATDIFLAALKGWRNVTLIGQASDGGSCFSQRVSLSKGDLQVRIGSMVSFQPSGILFDGNGVQPNIRINPIPENFLGGRGNVLAKAVEFILSKTR